VAGLSASVVLVVGATLWLTLRDDAMDRYPIEADVIEEDEVAGQATYVLANDQPGPRDVVLYMHGYGSSREAVTFHNQHEFTQDLVDDGFVVASSDAHGDAWGSKASQADYLALYRHLEQRFEVEDVVIVSESMGGIAGLNIAADRAIPELVGWVGISPVVDLQAAAESGPLVEPIREDVPAGQIEDVDPARLESIPVPVWVVVSKDDTYVPASSGEMFARRVGGEVVYCDGGHVAADCYRSDVVKQLLEP
jgi:pimeloyl-ACP methyl ester carboxylesterase